MNDDTTEMTDAEFWAIINAMPDAADRPSPADDPHARDPAADEVSRLRARWKAVLEAIPLSTAVALRVIEMDYWGNEGSLDPLAEICRVEGTPEFAVEPGEWEWGPRPTPYDTLCERELVLLAMYYVRQWAISYPRSEWGDWSSEPAMLSSSICLEGIRKALGATRFDKLVLPLFREEQRRAQARVDEA